MGSDLSHVAASDINDIEKLLIGGDLSKLTEEQRLRYYRYRCETLGLDPLSSPFNYLELQGKLVLYLNRGGGEQIRKNNKISIMVTDKRIEHDVFTVYVRATTPDGRTEEECGSVALKGAKGDMLANIQMKALTKAKRRATIAICGLGMLDETEVETIPQAQKVEPVTGKLVKDQLTGLLSKTEAEEMLKFMNDVGIKPADFKKILYDMGYTRLGEVPLIRSQEIWDKLSSLHENNLKFDTTNDPEINPPF